jgi:hypothetical protein
MPTVVSAGGTKSPYYADASYRTAAIRKAAIIGAQKAKNPPFDPDQKPFVKEQHIGGRFHDGILDATLKLNCQGFM